MTDQASGTAPEQPYPGVAGPGTEPDPEPRHRLARRVHTRLHANPVTGLLTKIVVTLAGVVVILVGVVLSGPGVPGPGFVVIIAGLAILATEWDWADRLLKRCQRWLRESRDKVRDMDPKVRRRRILLLLLAALVVAAVCTWAIWTWGWPSLAIDSWDLVQSIHSAIPELPGM